MIWVGLILAVIGVVLFFVSRRAADKAHHIQATDTSKVGDLLSLVSEIATDLGGTTTGYRDYIEIKGRVACDEPLRGELSDVEAAIFETTVQRVVERREERRDGQGNVRTEWRKHTETVSSNRREAPFFIADDSGRIRVKPTKKAIELEKCVDRFEPANAIEQLHGGNMMLSLGSFRVSVASGGLGSHSRTLGYKFVEKVLPVGRTVYALGELADTEDEGVVLRKPTDDDKKKPFLVSMKTEEELVRASKKSSTVFKVISGVLVAGGVALVIVGIVT